MTGVSPSGSGSRASHEAASASSPEASIPNAAQMPRPRKSDDAVVSFAAHGLAERVVEDWDSKGVVADWAEVLKKQIRYHSDGYELARDLERYHSISPDSALVEILDEAYSFMHSAFEDALTKWVAITGWTPRFAKGDRAVWRGKHGIVNGVKPETSEMYFAPDEDAPRYRQGGGYVVSEDELTAIAMEAREGPDRGTGLDGEAATARPEGIAQ